MPIRRFARIRNGADYQAVEVEDGGYPVYGSGGEFRRSREFLYDGESVLLGRKGTIDKPLYVTGRFWTVDTMFYTEIDQAKALPRFVYYAATTIPFDLYATNTALPSMTQENLLAHRLPLPGLRAQHACVEFLDSETAQIDALIEKQELLRRLLALRRTSLMERELGAIVGAGDRLGRHLFEVDDRAGSLGPELPLLAVSISWGVRRRDQVDVAQSAAADLSRYKVARKGDLVLNRMRAFQGALGVAPEDGVVSPDYAVLRVVNQVHAAWLADLMRTPRFVGEMIRRIKGIGTTESGAVRTPRINVADLLAIKIDLPELNAQVEQLGRTRQLSGSIDELDRKARRFIELAKERRDALITAVVTGQVDVQAEARA